MTDFNPTGYPDVNAIIQQVLVGAQEILGSHFVGMYLDGSLANGGFDEDSDIDFVIVTDEEVQGELFEALKAFHERVSAGSSPWAIQLEGSYISRQALRRHDPDLVVHPNIERGEGERLKMVEHPQDWDIHRYVLRQRGITLTGPEPRTLIDAVTGAQLRQAVSNSVPEWLKGFLAEPARISTSGYQSYIVLTMCRVLYTYQMGRIASKRTAADWARASLDPRWDPLIERAWIDRHAPSRAPAPEAVEETLAMIHYTLELLKK